MRLPCPYCGWRDSREFTCRGAALLRRPAPDAPEAEWEDFVHLRDNPAGPSRELWQHSGGCAAWLVVERDTLSHEVLGARPARDVARGTS